MPAGTHGHETPAFAFKFLSASHTFWYRLTGGRLGHRMGKLSFLLLDHVGSRSKMHYTTPLLYGQDGDDLVLVASRGGSRRDPAWYRNLIAHPEVGVQVGTRRLRVHARTASPRERPRLWALMRRQWPDFDSYQLSTDREIPVVVLEPEQRSPRP